MYVITMNLDGDSGMIHPLTNEILSSNPSGDFIFLVKSQHKQQFIDNLLNNFFQLDDKVYSCLIGYLEHWSFKYFSTGELGSYYFGNYYITINKAYEF